MHGSSPCPGIARGARHGPRPPRASAPRSASSARTIDAALPAVATPEGDPRNRRNALAAIAGVAAIAGDLGAPVLVLVQQILGMLGG
ncbi:hypothetical protein [Streptomyces sp. NPDC048057]|uniref:hypothetical protein n=1 Tax=Streptomyces sp. NPDC048057 TaxID=3155628 RepID=UPI0033FEDF93